MYERWIKKNLFNNEPPVPLYLDGKNREGCPRAIQVWKRRRVMLQIYETWSKREPFRVEFSRHRERVVTVESRLILERGYPGGRGGYLGHDQVAINIAYVPTERSLHRATRRPFSRSGMKIDIVATASEWFRIRSKSRMPNPHVSTSRYLLL